MNSITNNWYVFILRIIEKIREPRCLWRRAKSSIKIYLLRKSGSAFLTIQKVVFLAALILNAVIIEALMLMLVVVATGHVFQHFHVMGYYAEDQK